jgi:uncharacterized protein YbjT (DUF2867 family)
MTRFVQALVFMLMVSMTGGARAADGGVVVFGGNRGTGLETVKVLVAKGDQVTVMVRAGSDTAALKDLKVNVVTGDAMNPADVKSAMTSKPFRAVVSSLGGRSGGKRVDFEGNVNVTEAAKAAGVTRVVQVSAIGVGDSHAGGSPEVHKVLGAVFAEKVKAEDHLKASGLRYTIIRPGGLDNGAPTGNGLLTEDKTVGGTINRSDLGKLVADAIDDPKTEGKVYSAVDKNMMSNGPMKPRF